MKLNVECVVVRRDYVDKDWKNISEYLSSYNNTSGLFFPLPQMGNMFFFTYKSAKIHKFNILCRQGCRNLQSYINT